MKNHLNHNVTLTRQMGLFSATALVIANMIGTGLFTTSGFIMAELQHPVTFMLCWALGGLFALCGALCYGELGARHPKAGGEYVYLKMAYGPLMGFLSGWISLVVGFSAPIAAAAMAFAAYVLGMGAAGAEPFGVLRVAGHDLITFSPQTVISCLAIVTFTVLHYHSLRVGARVQNGLTMVKVGMITAFVIAALWVGKGDWAHATQDFQWNGLLSGDLAVSLIFVSFAYSGWNAAAYLGGEIRSPQRNLPLALICGTLLVTLLYLAVNAVFLYALSPGAMGGTLDVGTKAAVALFGNGAGKWVGAVIAIGLLSVLSAMIMTGPRVYYAMARDGVFFEKIGRLNKRHHTPALSIFLQAAIAMAMVLTSTFDQMLIYIGFTLSLSALLTVVGLMILRQRYPKVQGLYRTVGYPWTPLIFLLGNLWIIYYTVQRRPLASLMGLATIGLGLVAYWAIQRKPLKASLVPPSDVDPSGLPG